MSTFGGSFDEYFEVGQGQDSCNCTTGEIGIYSNLFIEGSLHSNTGTNVQGQRFNLIFREISIYLCHRYDEGSFQV